MVIESTQRASSNGIATEIELLDWICRYVAEQGFTFTRDVVADYYVSLKAKPFCDSHGDQRQRQDEAFPVRRPSHYRRRLGPLPPGSRRTRLDR